MSEKSKTNVGNQTAWASAWPSMMDAFGIHASALLREQAELISISQEMVAAWARRRQEDLQAAIEVARQLGNSKDFAGVADAYSTWWKTAIERAQEDFAEARDDTVRLTEVGQRTIEALQGGLQRVAGSARTQPPKQAAAE